MKHQMSLHQSDNVSFAIFGMIVGYLNYTPKIFILNMSFFSIDWVISSSHAVITAGLCAAFGWIGKKIAEVGYNYIVEYFRNKKNKNEKTP